MRQKCLLLAMLAASPVFAEPYVFLDFSRMEAETRTVPSTSGTLYSGLHFGAGYRYKYLAGEVSYLNLGNFRGFEGTTVNSWTATGFGLSAVGMLPVSDSLSLLAIAGIYYLKTEIQSQTGGVQNAAIRSDVSAPSFGAGIQYAWSDEFRLRATFRQLNGKEELDHLRMFSLGAIIAF